MQRMDVTSLCVRLVVVSAERCVQMLLTSPFQETMRRRECVPKGV